MTMATEKTVQVAMRVNIFLDPGNPQRAFKWTAGANGPNALENGRFTYDGKPGFKDSYSCNPDFADYDPSRYNRCLQLLHDEGIALDVPLAAVPASRKLADRWDLWSRDMRRRVIRKATGL